MLFQARPAVTSTESNLFTGSAFSGVRSQASGAGVVGWRDSNMTKPSDVLKRSGESKLSAREVEAAKLLLLKKFGK